MLETLCDRGMYLKAMPLLGQIDASTPIEARILAARAKGHLGARRKSEAEILSIWRNNRSNGCAINALLRSMVYRRGPYYAWKQAEKLALPEGSAPECIADWHSIRGYVLASFRDFDRAENAFKTAHHLAPDDPWLLVEWSYACEFADRYEDGIAHAEAALRIRPGYRAAIQALAHLKTLVGKDDEALQLLGEAFAESESAYLVSQLIELQIETAAYTDAWRSVERLNDIQPLADKHTTSWINSLRADVALRLGRLDDARTYAAACGQPFYLRLADRLAMGETAPGRVLLPVGFVRQHYQTCAPATLAALSGYWSKPSNHLEIAEEICYDGTPYHSERRWAETQGFLTREFTVDWSVACALIDAGVPFTLTTVYTGGAHLQAVIGYDALRGTLLIRDPFKRAHAEYDQASLFESHRSSGPRGMLLLPVEESHRLDGIHLPDTDLWNGYHEVMAGLTAHDRDSAAATVQRVEALAPDHRLTLWCRRAIAAYDGNEAELLQTTERLIDKFPEDVNLRLAKAASITVLGERSRQLDWLQATSSTTPADAQAIVQYAQLLSDDGRENRHAEMLLDSALRIAPTNGSAWFALATVLWQQGRCESAIDCYRTASCLVETNEDFASSYFRAAHFTKATENGLAFLRHRIDRLGNKSTAPVITMFQQLEMLARTTEAFGILEQALAEHPDDGTLLIFAADNYLAYGKPAEARACLETPGARFRRAMWLHSNALLSRDSGDIHPALAMARESAALEPFSLIRHRLVASLLLQAEGSGSAVAYMRETAGRFPHHCGIQELLIGWLSESPLNEIEPAIRHLLAVCPSHAWAQRELVANLARQNRLSEAREAFETALVLAPNHSSTYSTGAFLFIREGRIAEARKHLRAALEQSVDDGYAMNALLDLCASDTERTDALSFIHQQLVKQVTLGDGLLNLQSAAQSVLDPATLLQLLREANAERPDLWHSWAALVSQLTDTGHTEEANSLVAEALARFPLLPRLYFERARLQLLSGAREACRDSLSLALQIAPSWPVAVRMYVNSILDEGGDYQRALDAVEAALRKHRDQPQLLALKADTLRRMDRHDEAIADAKASLKLDPQPRWVWDMLRHLGQLAGDLSVAEATAREVIDCRPGDANAWVKLAEYCQTPGEAMAAADKALELEPRSRYVFEVRLDLLLRLQRFGDLEVALANPPWEGFLPVTTRAFSARLIRARGDEVGAIQALRSLLNEDPNQFALWQELADWCERQSRKKSYLEAAQHMARIAPNYHVAHGYLAQAYLYTGNETQAIEHLERAMEIDPSYAFAAYSLADIYIGNGHPDRAKVVLDRTGAQTAGIPGAVRKLRIAAMTGKNDAAAEWLKEIITSTGDTQWACQTSFDALTKAGCTKLLDETVRACIADGKCSANATNCWLRMPFQESSWDVFYRQIGSALHSDPSNVLKRELLSYIGEKKEIDLLQRFVNEFRTALAADEECWGMVSYAYLANERIPDVVEWMSDWRQRENAPPWALDNLAVALRTLNEPKTAREVSLESLRITPNNPDAKTWLAVDAARDNDVETLAALIADVDADQLRPYYKNLLHAAKAYLGAAKTGSSRHAVNELAQLRQPSKTSKALGIVVANLKKSLLINHTPVLARPLRWLQFAVA